MLRWRGRRKCHTRGALKAMREPHARGRVWGRSKRDGGRAGGASRRARCGARKRARPHHARVQGEELWVGILRCVSDREHNSSSLPWRDECSRAYGTHNDEQQL